MFGITKRRFSSPIDFNIIETPADDISNVAVGNDYTFSGLTTHSQLSGKRRLIVVQISMYGTPGTKPTAISFAGVSGVIAEQQAHNQSTSGVGYIDLPADTPNTGDLVITVGTEAASGMQVQTIELIGNRQWVPIDAVADSGAANPQTVSVDVTSLGRAVVVAAASCPIVTNATSDFTAGVDKSFYEEYIGGRSGMFGEKRLLDSETDTDSYTVTATWNNTGDQSLVAASFR